MLQKDVTKNRFLTIAVILVAAVGFFVIGLRQGYIPLFTFPGLGLNYLLMGVGNFISTADYLDVSVQQLFIPKGLDLTQGFLIYFVINLFNKILNNIELSTVLMYFLFYVVSITCLFSVFYKISKNLILSTLLTLLFYLDPLFRAQSGLPSVTLGLMLIPLSVLFDMYFFSEREKPFSKSRYLGLFVLSYIIRLVYPSVSWYVAVILAAGSCLFFLTYWTLNFKTEGPKILKYLSVIFLPWVLALFTIKSLMPQAKVISDMSSPISFFRAASPDILTILLPSDNIFISKFFSIKQHLLEQGLTFSGDDTMWNNYPGAALLCVSLWLVLKNWKNNTLITSAFISGVITLILGLGPSLKIGSTVPVGDGYQYFLEFNKVIVDYPWKNIYEHFPFNVMRAVYRWLIIPKFLLLIGFGYAMKLALDKNKKVLVTLLCLLAFFEFLPRNVGLERGITSLEQLNKFNSDVIKPLQKVDFKPNDRVLFIPSENDFLVPYIASKLNFKTYNGGGDKHLEIARHTWPPTVKSILEEKNPTKVANLILMIREKQLAEYVILPFFSLRWESYYWPVNAGKYEKLKNQADVIRQKLSGEIDVVAEKYFYVFNLKTERSAEKEELVNGSFEKALTGWSKQGNPPIIGAGFNDSFAVSVDKHNTVCQEILLQTNSYLNIRFISKAASKETTGVIEVTWRDLSDKVVDLSRLFFTSTNQYQQFGKDIKIPSGAKYVIIKFASSNNSHPVIIDNVAVISFHIPQLENKKINATIYAAN